MVLREDPPPGEEAQIDPLRNVATVRDTGVRVLVMSVHG
jgi:hypothetical protein